MRPGELGGWIILAIGVIAIIAMWWGLVLILRTLP
jgi:hypothetical protein